MLRLDLYPVRANNVHMGISGLSIDQMTVGEKVSAMEALWDSLCRDEANIPVQEWHKQLLDDRRIRIGSGELKFIDWETAKEHIRDRTS